jgi:bacillopeptidase F (M6 metalloprotease family)
MYGYAPATTGDFSIGMTNNVSLPAGGAAYLVFNHAYSFESGYSYTYDGGRVEYSLNGGPWQDAYPLIDSGLDYNAEVFTGADNPLSGELAFGGASAGYGSTRVNLSGLQGQAIRFRFRIGTDWTTDDYGWYIDDVRIFTCFDPSGLSQKIYLPVTLSPWE